MRNTNLILFIAIAMLCLTAPIQAAPLIVVGNYDLLPNTPGQKIPLYVTGIVPNAGPNIPLFDGNVDGMVLSVAINEGGVGFPQFGGLPGPVITSIDVDSGPTIWVAPNSPAGHNPPASYIDVGGQLAEIDFLTVSGWVNVTGGLVATLIVDTTGFDSGTYRLTLNGGILGVELPNTEILGVFEPPDGHTDFIYQYYNGTAGQITIVPEPSSLLLGLFAVAGLAAVAMRKRRARLA